MRTGLWTLHLPAEVRVQVGECIGARGCHQQAAHRFDRRGRPVALHAEKQRDIAPDVVRERLRCELVIWTPSPFEGEGGDGGAARARIVLLVHRLAR